MPRPLPLAGVDMETSCWLSRSIACRDCGRLGEAENRTHGAAGARRGTGSSDLMDDGHQVRRRIHRSHVRDHQRDVARAQGQAKAKAEGRYKGRPEDTNRNEGIAGMLASGASWSRIQGVTGASRTTIAKIAKRRLAGALAG
jgi:hypothetical protein